MIDSTIVRTHQRAVGIKRGLGPAEALDRSRGGLTIKLYASCDGKSRPIVFVLAPGGAHNVHGFSPLFRMITGKLKALLAACGYDADTIRIEVTSMASRR